MTLKVVFNALDFSDNRVMKLAAETTVVQNYQQWPSRGRSDGSISGWYV